MQTHHELVMSLIDPSGKLEYDWFPHHIWSVPWLYREFQNLDKRLIESYTYESKSICLSYEEGKIKEEVKRFDSFEIPVTLEKNTTENV